MKAKITPRINSNRTALNTVVPLNTPWVLFIDPASSCNFKCTFCPTGDLQLMKNIGRYQGTLKYDDYTQIIDQLDDFDEKIKVLRLYKDGEPLVNRDFAKMISYAKESKQFGEIDTTTNGALLTHKKSEEIINAGINKINISLDGLNEKQFRDFARAKVDMNKYISNIKYLHEISGDCQIVVKTVNEVIGKNNKNLFYDTFGDICDHIFVENVAPCWPDFDVEERMGLEIKEGIYGNEIKEIDTCAYLFYSMAVNSDMKVSACFLDWSRGLSIGDLRKEKISDIWNGSTMNAHRVAHLKGLRKNHPICGKCGQLSHCSSDNIDPFTSEILSKIPKVSNSETLLVERSYQSIPISAEL